MRSLVAASMAAAPWGGAGYEEGKIKSVGQSPKTEICFMTMFLFQIGGDGATGETVEGEWVSPRRKAQHPHLQPKAPSRGVGGQRQSKALEGGIEDYC